MEGRRGPRLGVSNIAISHILSTQVTLWLLHFDRNYGSCGYSAGFLKVNGSKIAEDMIAESLSPSLPLLHFLRPIVHHYQLLTIVVIACIWLMNNSIKHLEGQSFLSGKTSFFADDDFTYNFLKRKASVKGFFLGLLMAMAAIIVIFLQDLHLSLISHTALQVRRRQ
jgi:hypothetical protein